MEKGYNYYDTAFPYHNGKSEIAFKEAVSTRYPRDSYILADKLPVFNITKEEELEPIFSLQLERCDVDYFDYYLLHNVSPSGEKGFIDVDSYGFLKQKKDEGKIKKLGFSSHGNAQYIEDYIKKYPDMDFIQLQINYLDWESNTIQSKKCYEVAKKHGLEVIVMEPLKGGFLTKIPEEAEERIKEFDANLTPAQLALRFVASLDNVIMILSGASSYKQIEENIDTFDYLEPLSPEEYKLVDEVRDIINSKITVSCTQCNYCINECPVNINIPHLFDLYNGEEMLDLPITTYQVTYLDYADDETKGQIADCIECGKCSAKCPQHIDIPAVLKDVANTFKDAKHYPLDIS